MNTDKVVIKFEGDTKTFERQIDELEDKLWLIDQKLSQPKKLGLKEKDIAKLKTKAEKLNNQLFILKKRQAELDKNHIFDNIGKGIDGVIKKVAKWSLAIVGIRSIYMGIRSAMSTLGEYDNTITNRVDYLKWVLANAIKPVIEWIINALYKIVNVIGRVIFELTGYNIFKNSGIDDYKKALESSGKSAKDLKKTLAGFDEMNVLTDNTQQNNVSSQLAGLGDGLGDTNKDFKEENRLVNKAVKLWKKLGSAMEETLSDYSGFEKAFGYFGLFFNGILEVIHGLWDMVDGFATFLYGILEIIVGVVIGDGYLLKEGIKAIGEGIFSIIKGVVEMIWGVIKSVVGVIYAFIVEIVSGIKGLIQLFLEVIVNMIKNTWGLIKIVLNAIISFVDNIIIKPIAGLVSWLWESIKTGAKNGVESVKNIWNGIVSWFNNTIISPVSNFFSGMWNGLKNGARTAWEGIKSVFSTVGSWFTTIFSNAWKGVINVFSAGGRIFVSIKDAILNGFKWIVNALIDGINNVVSIPFNGINSAFDGLRRVDLWGWKPFEWVPRFNVPKIPHLAKGGILNNPGKGVYTGTAIAGEAGREFYMPLQDEQMLSLVGEAIGKYVNINLTNITELDGRQIARKVEQINQNNRFVLNR